MLGNATSRAPGVDAPELGHGRGGDALHLFGVGNIDNHLNYAAALPSDLFDSFVKRQERNVHKCLGGTALI